MQCPTCGADDQEDWKFCESCGTVLQTTSIEVTLQSAGSPDAVSTEQPQLTVTAARCRCGAAAELRDSLGYCTVCGLKVTPAHKPDDPADHREIIHAPHFAAVTDRGRRHPTNQDNVAIAMETIDGKPVYVIVVCDGLSSSCAAEAASETAAKTACDALAGAVNSDPSELQGIMLNTILAAHEAVCGIPFTPDPDKDGPATTIVAALVRGETATIGWVGDSRAYLLTTEGAGPALLSHDHSWVNAMVDDGVMSMEEAMKSPESHVITQCLGPTTEGDGSLSAPPEPSVISVQMPGSACLLLCSDGMWNFIEEPKQIAMKVADLNVGPDALSIARSLVQFANSCGGRDNITVAALCMEPGAPSAN